MPGKKHVKLRKYLPLYVMLIPGVVYLLVNNYLPMTGLLLAFKKINYSLGLLQSPWTGLRNFTFLLKTKDAYIIFRNTILYNLAFIVLGNLMGICVAIALDNVRKRFLKSTAQRLILIPFLLSTVIISYIVFAFLSPSTGLVNKSILPLFGMAPISWYNQAQYWPVILTVVFLWMSFGYSSIIYYATLLGIDSTHYEAAVLDGCGIPGQIRYITLPGLKPTIITLSLLAIGRICYSDFGLFYQIPQNSGLLLSTTNTIDTYVYRGLMELNDIGRATAAGFLQSMLGFLCVLAANFTVSRLDKDRALF